MSELLLNSRPVRKKSVLREYAEALFCCPAHRFYHQNLCGAGFQNSF